MNNKNMDQYLELSNKNIYDLMENWSSSWNKHYSRKKDFYSKSDLGDRKELDLIEKIIIGKPKGLVEAYFLAKSTELLEGELNDFKLADHLSCIQDNFLKSNPLGEVVLIDSCLTKMINDLSGSPSPEDIYTAQ